MIPLEQTDHKARLTPSGPDLLRLALELLSVNGVREIADRALALLQAADPTSGWALLQRLDGDRYEAFVRGAVGHGDLRQLTGEACEAPPWLAIHDALPADRLRDRVVFRALRTADSGDPDLLLACWFSAGRGAPLDAFGFETATRMIRAALDSARVLDYLVEQSSRDALTGLLNRRGILESLRRELALGRRRGTPISVLFLDVDEFKAINDRHGHATGDEVLIAVAGLIDDQLRASDAVGRLGGDEFLIVLGDTDLQTARRVGRRVTRNVGSTPIRAPSGELTVRLAYGAASIDEGLDETLLIERADHRMLSQKKRRRSGDTRRDGRPTPAARLAGSRS